MKQTRFLIIAFAAMAALYACSKDDTTTCEELLIGSWARSESSKSGGTSDTLSINKNRTFEWTYYENVSGSLGYNQASSTNGTWLVSNDTIYMHFNKEFPLNRDSEAKYKIVKLDNDSLFLDMIGIIRKMHRVK